MTSPASDASVIEAIGALSDRLARHPKRELYGAADFWTELGEKHKTLIAEHGFAHFKRTINFEYHQEQVHRLRDPKITRLIRSLLGRGRVPYGPLFTRIDRAAVKDLRLIRPLPYAVFVGLLWQYARAVDRLGVLDACEEPAFGDPIPVRYGGRLISQDLATSAIELNTIARVVDVRRLRRIAEIGSGYGRLAHVVKRTLPHVEYCLFDVPPALVVAQTYLAAALGASAVDACPADGHVDTAARSNVRAFLPHHLEAFADGTFDLVINVSSFDEMPRPQVENYLALIDRTCAGSLYLKGHAVAPAWCRISGGGLCELPYPRGWRLLHEEPDPFLAAFIARIYATRETAA